MDDRTARTRIRQERPNRLLIALTLAVLAGATMFAFAAPGPQSEEQTRLAVVWTSGDPEVAHRMCLMYTHAAERYDWFDEVQLIVWGPSARLLAADKDLQAKIGEMMEDGVQLRACIVCADSYGVTEDLRALGIEVKPMGKPLSDLVQSGWDVLTF